MTGTIAGVVCILGVIPVLIGVYFGLKCGEVD